MTVKKLTAKREMFCQEYLVDLNGTQAAIRAGYSEKTAGQIAEQTLKKLEIQYYIAKLKEKRQEATKITAEWVLKEAEECYNALKKQNAHKDALKALDLIGRHTVIKAFDKNESHHHTGEFKLDVVFVTKELNKDDTDIDNTYSR